MSSGESWSSCSWKSKPIAQDVEYPDPVHLSKIETLPPLVPPSEIPRLRYQLSLVQRNEAFLLHAGDCAESFDANISANIGLILSFSLIVIWGARVLVVRASRLYASGASLQYAKPRGIQTKMIGGREILRFRGDNVNRLDPNDRTPDPERLLSAYFHSTATVNYVRGLLTSGFVSLHRPRDWSLAHVRSPALRCVFFCHSFIRASCIWLTFAFSSIVSGLSDGLDFSHTIGFESTPPPPPTFEQGGVRGTVGEVHIYSSHEGLMLKYEQALARAFAVPASATGAHVEYFRGIWNPIDVKVGPSMQNEELVQLLDTGRVTLITRYGADEVRSDSRAIRRTSYAARAQIEEHLAGHIAAVQQSGHPVIWICDPMHGNTQISASGLRTQHFEMSISELTVCLRIHAACGSRLGGVSLEFMGELNVDGFSVTGCVGGSEEHLGLRYQMPQTFCDLRLDFKQSLDVAFLLSNYFKRNGSAGEEGQAPAGFVRFLQAQAIQAQMVRKWDV
ncbi:DAHP synthetase [Mycena latifolia]|nr:DAHP synthetase [Mycena latifolia]